MDSMERLSPLKGLTKATASEVRKMAVRTKTVMPMACALVHCATCPPS